ncbi:MAG: arsenate reductase family protein [Crocinitomicaceae bacterium]
MTKLFHLSNCSTCQRIIKDLNLPENTVFQDIKEESITEDDLEKMKKSIGSFEGLFSKRAMKYRGLGLHDQTLTESDYKRLILEEYTFLKRPVLFHNGQVFVGNSKKVVEAAKTMLHP